MYVVTLCPQKFDWKINRMAGKNKKQRLNRKRKNRKAQSSNMTSNNSEVILEQAAQPHSEEYTRLNAIEKLVQKLKSSQDRDTLFAMKSVLTATKTDIEKKNTVFKILENFLGIMEHFSLEDLEVTSVKFRERFIPRQLIELTSKNLKLDGNSVIGRGAFGIITKGIMRNPDGSSEKVAIKSTLKEEYNYMIQNEAEVLSQLVHKNVVKLLRFQKNPMKIVLELMDLGDITKVLEVPGRYTKHLLNIFQDVACGMEYIADKKFIHRDLTARNIFVNSRLECKIGDFGFCVYVGDSDGSYEDENLGGYHLSPEVRLTKTFTTKSDVWAMGIFICQVYATIIDSMTKMFDLPPKMDVIRLLPLCFDREIKLEIASWCPSCIRSYVQNDILNDHFKERPTFTNIRRKISEILKQETNY
ncbi:ephrin type-A receptor 1 isoform X1 [Leptinotarsa decemlineata]|uniref:ephrin type-A receptor 1 isoform X1 n=2 Tax=Leptinotarsa decemlineata TaxID=7539 RepID=UPI003D30BE56